MCALSSERGADDSKTKVAGNDTMIGQIATFMEVLHLSFDEVFEKIPYSMLLIMQKDKLHEVTGDIVQYKSARDMARGKNMVNE